MAEREGSAILIVDCQEKFRPVIPGLDRIVENLVLLIRAARVLRVPILVTEQYPKGLGSTLPELTSHLDGIKVIEKTSFSCFGEPKFIGRLRGMRVRTLIVGGLEAHICVAQTALHALQMGYRVHILADAVGARNDGSVRVAFDRLKMSGATVSSVEMALFELLGRAGTPEFKEIQSMLKPMGAKGAAAARPARPSRRVG